MTTPTHAVAGLLIGTVTGHPLVGLVSAVIVDVDHLALYAHHGVLSSSKLFWETITTNEDPYNGQRGWLHSLLIATPLSVVIWIASPVWGSTIVLSYILGHLALDVLDSADYWPLYPFKRINIRGPVRFFSGQEGLVFTLLALINIKLWL